MTAPWYSRGPKGDKGDKGDTGTGVQGPPGPANVLTAGPVTTLAPGEDAAIDLVTTSPGNQRLDASIPRGAKGDKGDQGNVGPASALSLGTTNTGAPGTNAIVELSGSAPSQVISFTIPRGSKGDQGNQGDIGPEGPRGYGYFANAGVPTVTEPSGPPDDDLVWYLDTITGEFWIWVETTPGTKAWVHQPARGSLKGAKGDQGLPGGKGDKGDQGDPGPANSLSIGTVTGLATGATPTASITGAAPSQTLNLGLPAGPKGDKGDKGDPGDDGEVSEAMLNTAVNNAVAALVDDSPAALDTLNELAAALGDDPNFATTMTNALAEKVGNTDSRLTDSRTPTDGSVTQAKLAPNGGFFNKLNLSDLTAPGYTFGKGNWIVVNDSDPNPANHFMMYIVYGANQGESPGDASARGIMTPVIVNVGSALSFANGTIDVFDSGITSAKINGGAVTAAKIAGGVLPMDMSFIVFGKDTTRAAGTGDNPFGHKFQRNVTVQSVTFRCLTADASGNLVVEICKNGTAVSGTNTTLSAANQVGGVTTSGLSATFSAGDIITIQVTGVGTTPGKGLVADIKAVAS